MDGPSGKEGSGAIDRHSGQNAPKVNRFDEGEEDYRRVGKINSMAYAKAGLKQDYQGY